jgi:hypothetical protein
MESQTILYAIPYFYFDIFYLSNRDWHKKNQTRFWAGVFPQKAEKYGKNLAKCGDLNAWTRNRRSFLNIQLVKLQRFTILAQFSLRNEPSTKRKPSMQIYN